MSTLSEDVDFTGVIKLFCQRKSGGAEERMEGGTREKYEGIWHEMARKRD